MCIERFINHSVGKLVKLPIHMSKCYPIKSGHKHTDSFIYGPKFSVFNFIDTLHLINNQHTIKLEVYLFVPKLDSLF